MTSSTIQCEIGSDLDPCHKLQQLLHSLAVVSAVYDPNGCCLLPPLRNPSETKILCGDCSICLGQNFEQAVQNSHGRLTPESFTKNHSEIVALPLLNRRKVTAFFLCCLKSMQYKQTLCDSRLAGIFQGVLLSLLKNMQENQQAAEEIEDLTNSLSQSYEELALMHRISDGMRINRKPQEFFDRFAQEIREVVEAEKLLIFWSPTNQTDYEPPMVAFDGEPALEMKHLQIIWDRVENRTPGNDAILLDSNIERPYTYQWPEPIRNIVCVPIRRQRRLIGALVALNKINKPDFNSIDTKLLISVANEIAVFLENFCLYDDLQDLLLGSLRALTSSIDAKDPYTCGHSARVAMICRRLAEQLSLEADQVNDIYLAGLLHDVGKIGIEEAVLSKPGRLTDDEFVQIKKHPRIGADILHPIRQMQNVTPAVLSHHERFDGRGYPYHLAGMDIPLAGRIVMLADSFDAMISHRTYRKAMPLDATLAEINRYSGTQFDPQIADAFLDINVTELVKQLDSIADKTRQLKNPLESLYQPVMS